MCRFCEDLNSSDDFRLSVRGQMADITDKPIEACDKGKFKLSIALIVNIFINRCIKRKEIFRDYEEPTFDDPRVPELVDLLMEKTSLENIMDDTYDEQQWRIIQLFDATRRATEKPSPVPFWAVGNHYGFELIGKLLKEYPYFEKHHWSELLAVRKQ